MSDTPGPTIVQSAGEDLGTAKSDRPARKRSRALRLGVLVAVLAGVTVNGYLHQHPIGALRTVGVDALCPFGGLESLWSLLAGGSMLSHIATSTFVVFLFTVVVALVFRRVFCGYLCPLGTLQELFGKVGRRLFGRTRPQLPEALDRPARYLKYGVLLSVTLLTWLTGQLVIRAFDPWVAYMHLSSAEVFAEFSLGLVVLGVSLVGSVVYDRFFCRYLCPMGALLGLVSQVAPFAVRRNAATCTSCGACDKACPVAIPVSSQKSVTTAECLSCNECVNACPVADTLVVGAKAGNKRVIVAPGRVLGATALALVAIVGFSTAAGAFAWTMPTNPVVKNGQVDPESIRGYMTFEQIAAYTGIPPMVLESRFGVEPSDMIVPIKDIAATYGFDVHTDVREFVVEQAPLYMGSTAAPAEGG